PRPPLFPYTTLFRSGHVADPAREGSVDSASAQRPTVELDLPGGRLDEPDDRVCDRGRAGAAQAEEPEALARMHRKAHVLDRAERDRKSTRLNSSHLG